MAVYTDLFTATEGEVAHADLEHHPPSEFFPTVQAKGISPLELATLEAIVYGEDAYSRYETTIDAIDQNVVRNWENTWVHRLPDAFVSTFARLDPSRLAGIATTWGNTEEFIGKDGQPADLRWLVEAYYYLTRRAERQGKQVFLWIAV